MNEIVIYSLNGHLLLRFTPGKLTKDEDKYLGHKVKKFAVNSFTDGKFWNKIA